MPTKSFKILGQEPAALLGVVQALLTLLLSFGLLGLTPETNGVILAAVSAGFGLVAAYATRTTLYAALVGFVQAILVLAVTFGLNLDDTKQGAILAAVSVVAGLYLRQTSNAVDTPISSASPGALKEDLELLALTAPAPVPVVDVTMSLKRSDPEQLAETLAKVTSRHNAS